MNSKKHKNTDLTAGSITGTLLSFSVPFILSNLLQTLYGTVDTWTVGNFSSTASVSAVSTGAQILCLMTYLALGLSSGATVLLGQAIGAKDYKRASKIVGNTVIDFAVLSLILTALLLILYPWLLTLLNIPDEARKEAEHYLIICSLGIPMIVGYNTVCAILRAIGDSKSPLLFVAIAAVVNIAGDMLMTGVFRLGAAGVAISTIASEAISFIFSLIFIMKRGMGFSFSLRDIRFDGKTTGSIFKVGIPMGVQSILINLSFLFITSIINSMGLTASAAMGIGDKIVNFSFLPQNSISGALSVIVAQNIGAKKEKRAVASVRTAIIFCLAIEFCFFIFCQIFPETLPKLFTRDAEVLKMTGLYMRAYSIDALFTSYTFCMSGFVNGCGKTAFNMTQNLIATFLGRIPATFFLSRLANTNLFLIGLAAPASTLISIVLISVYVFAGFWKKGLYKKEAAGKEE